ncbi:hypothetical protein J4436_03025 [Candidatus Woesearchaeota archaeon]|nr:hypothetical protein [Candidatus Woesearchaeota archaeon]
MISNLFKKAFIVGAFTIFFDFIFHKFLTHPMESLTYFMIKFLLAFFVAIGIYTLNNYRIKKRFIIPISGLIFSTLMSIYYRMWELGEAGVPFGSRAPDIIGISRDNLILFSGTWWFGHAIFFIISILIADKLVNSYGD